MVVDHPKNATIYANTIYNTENRQCTSEQQMMLLLQGETTEATLAAVAVKGSYMLTVI